MSALTGLATSAGRIPTSGGAVTGFQRGMGFVGPALKIVSGAAPPFYSNGSVLVVAGGAVLTDGAGAITHHKSGLPFTATGALATALAVPATFSQGVGITVDGRVAIN